MLHSSFFEMSYGGMQRPRQQWQKGSGELPNFILLGV